MKVRISVPERRELGEALRLAVALLSTWAMAHATPENGTVAVVATGPDLAPLADMVQVALSGAGVPTVERSLLDKALNELGLTAAGLAGRNEVLQLSRLVRADVFLLLSADEGAKTKARRGKEARLARVRLLDTRYGIRLLDVFDDVDADGLDACAARVCASANAARSAWNQKVDGVLPLGIVNVRRVELDATYEWLCRALPAVLSARLNLEPAVVVLEREDLRLLREEKLLTDGATGAFWRSGVLLDGVLRRAQAGAVEVTVSLRRPTGQTMGTVNVVVDSGNIQHAVGELAPRILTAMAREPSPATWRRSDEAEEFYRSGALLYRHERHTAALPLLETAHALDPTNVEYLKLLYLNDYQSNAKSRVPLYTGIERAELVSRLVRRLQALYEESGAVPQDVRLSDSRFGVGFFLDVYFLAHLSADGEPVRLINRDTRKIWAQISLHEWERRKAGQQGAEMQLRSVAFAGADSAEEALARVAELFETYVRRPGSPDTPRSGTQRLLAYRYWTEEFGLGNALHFLDSHQSFATFWSRYLIPLAEEPDPLLRFAACSALVKLKGRRLAGARQDRRNEALGRTETIDTEAYCRQIIGILKDELRTPDEPLDRMGKTDLREQIRDCVECTYRPTFDGKVITGHGEALVACLETFYRPLIETGDVENLLLWRPGRIDTGCFRRLEPAQRYVRLLSDISEVLLASTTQAKEAKADATRIADTIARLRKRFPDVAAGVHRTQYGAEMVLRKADWFRDLKLGYPLYFDICTAQQEKLLWVAFAKHYSGETRLGVVGLDLKTRKLVALRQMEHSSARMMPGRMLSGLVIAPARSYVALKGLGLLELPGADAGGREFLDNPRLLTTEHGLPSVHITGLAADDQSLWVAYGNALKSMPGKTEAKAEDVDKESGLGRYDPDTGQWTTVLCSSLGKDSPFCNGVPYHIRSLVAMPGQLLFIVDSTASDQSLWGLWSLDISTGAPRQIGWQTNTGYVLAQKLEVWNGAYWLRSTHALSRLVPEPELITMVFGDMNPGGRQKPRIPFGKSLLVPWAAQKDLTFGLWWTGVVDLATAAAHDGELWARSGKTQLVHVCKKQGKATIETVPNDLLDGEPVVEFVSTAHGLVAIGSGCVGVLVRQ